MTGFNKVMRFCNTLQDYESAKNQGTITDDLFVVILQDKLAKFKGQTFDWSQNADLTALATKGELEDLAEEIASNERVWAEALNDLNERINEIGTGGGGGTSDIVVDAALSTTSTNAIQNKAVANALNEKADASALASKQDTLVSGINIKTVQGESILGEGNIKIPFLTVESSLSDTSMNPVQNKVIKAELDKKVNAVDISNAFVNQGVAYSYEYNQFYDQSVFDSTDFIRIGQKLKGRMFLGGPNYPKYCIIFFDKDKNIISRYLGESDTASLQYFDLSQQIPEGAEFIVASNYNEYREESYILFDGYEYAKEIEAISEATKTIPNLTKNLGDFISGEVQPPVNENISFGIKCNTGKVKVNVSILSGDVNRDIRWFIYRYTNGEFNSTALGSITLPETTVIVEVPDGDDGIWLFRGKESISYSASYQVLSGLNMEEQNTSEKVEELESVTDSMQIDIQSIQEDIKIIPELKEEILALNGSLGSREVTSTKNRIAIWIDDAPEEQSYQIKITSQDSPLTNTNIYKAATDHSGLEVVLKDAALGEWITLQRDEAKPVLYILNVRAEDINVEARSYLIEFWSLNSLAQEIENLKNQYNNSLWTNATVVCFGDSITENVDFTKSKSYPDYIQELTGANVYNLGIGGTQLRQRTTPVDNPTEYRAAYAALDIINMVKASCEQNFTKQIYAAKFLTTDQGDNNESIVARMQTIDWSKVDVVTILGGTNDWNNAPTAWGEATIANSDINTTFGSINEIVRILLTTYPHLRIFWFSPTVRWLTDDSGARTDATWSDNFEKEGTTLREFSERVAGLVENHHLPVCDMYNTLGWNKYNFSQFFSATDGTHPRVGEGTLQIARKMVAFINANRTF